MKFYNDLDLQGNRLLNVANLPNDLLDIKLLHAKDLNTTNPILPTYTETSAGSGVYEWHDIDEYAAVTPVETENPQALGWYERSGSGTELDPYVYTLSTDTEVDPLKTYYINQWDEKYSALCYAYKTTSGNILIQAISVSDFLQEAEFKDGLDVDSNGEVRILIDPTSAVDSQSNPLLTVSPSGLKFSGSTLSAEQLAAIAWAIEKRREEIEEEAEGLFLVDTTTTSNDGSVSGKNVTYNADERSSASMTVTVTVSFNGDIVVPDNESDLLDDYGWSKVDDGVYRKSITGASGTIGAQEFVYTPSSGDYAGITCSKNSSVATLSAVYPAFYGFVSSNDEDDIATVITQLTRTTSRYSSSGALNNNRNYLAYYWIVTHGSATASDVTAGNFIELKTSAATFTSTQGSGITMENYKVYISYNPADANGALSSNATVVINL